MVFRGNVGEISRRQQSIKSIKEKLQKLDCQLTANEEEGGGGGHNIVTEPYEESGKFCISPPPPQVIDNDGSLSTNCETGERQSYLRGLLFRICVILAVW